MAFATSGCNGKYKVCLCKQRSQVGHCFNSSRRALARLHWPTRTAWKLKFWPEFTVEREPPESGLTWRGECFPRIIASSTLRLDDDNSSDSQPSYFRASLDTRSILDDVFFIGRMNRNKAITSMFSTAATNCEKRKYFSLFPNVANRTARQLILTKPYNCQTAMCYLPWRSHSIDNQQTRWLFTFRYRCASKQFRMECGVCI